MSGKVEPQHVLWQVENSGVLSEHIEVLLRFAVFQPADLSLSETEPPPEKLLVERLAERQEMAGMVSIRLENLADMLTFKCGPEFIGVKEFVPELGRWRAELVTLFSVTSAAQVRGVVRSERCSAVLTATPPGDQTASYSDNHVPSLRVRGVSDYANLPTRLPSVAPQVRDPNRADTGQPGRC